MQIKKVIQIVFRGEEGTNHELKKKLHLVGEHNLQNGTVQGLTGEQGRTHHRRSGFILMYKPNQLLLYFLLTNNSKKTTEKLALFSFSHLSHIHMVDWVQALGQLERGVDK